MVLTSFHLTCERFGMTPNPVVTEDDEDDDDKDVKNLQPSSQGCHGCHAVSESSFYQMHIFFHMENPWGFAVILWKTIFRIQQGSGMIWNDLWGLSGEPGTMRSKPKQWLVSSRNGWRVRARDSDGSRLWWHVMARMVMDGKDISRCGIMLETMLVDNIQN